MKYILCITLFVIILMTSCIKDTCNSRLGVTFMSLELDEATIADNEVMMIRFEVETLDTLPLAYFAGVRLNVSKEIDTLISTKTEINIIYDPGTLPAIGDSLSTVAYLNYVDRRRHIDCQHGGSDDKYELNFSYDIVRPDEQNIDVTNVIWEEIFTPGHY